MSQKVSLGVIGLRNIGMGHVRNASRLEGVKLVAGADTDAGRLEAAASEFGLTETYTSADALLADSSVDAVVLAVPNHLHAPLAIAAMQAGKHVLVEKPMCRTSEEAREMIKVRDETGRILMVGMNQRFSPAIYGLRDMIASGTLGNMYYAEARWLRQRLGEINGKGVWGRGDWFLTREASGGGPMVDIGVHKLDLVMFLLGFPEVLSVTGFCSYGIGREEAARHGKSFEVEDMALGVITCAGGLSIQIQASYFHNDRPAQDSSMSLHGTKGGVRTDPKLDAFLIDEGAVTDLAVEPVEDAPRSCVEHFARVIQGTEALCATPEQGLLCTQLIEAIYESADTGGAVTFG